jgi:2-hydroxychromene-2-carboxylate isomerase
MAGDSLQFWFCFRCPYSFLAWEGLKQSIPVVPGGVVLKPLDFEGVTAFLVQHPAVISTTRLERLSLRAQAFHTDIQRHDTWNTFTGILMRGLQAYSGADQITYMDTTFRMIFTSPAPLTQENLATRLSESGLNSQACIDMLNNPLSSDVIRQNVTEWEGLSQQLLPRLQFQHEVLAGFMDQPGIERFFSGLPF